MRLESSFWQNAMARLMLLLAVVSMVLTSTQALAAGDGDDDADETISAWTFGSSANNQSGRSLLTQEESKDFLRSPDEQVVVLNFAGLQRTFARDQSRLATPTNDSHEQPIHTMRFPLPGRGTIECELVPSQIFHPDLALKLPDVIIRAGRCSDSSRVNLNMQLGHQDSFSASFSVPDKNDWVYVDSRAPETNEYVIYLKSKAQRKEGETVTPCGTKRRNEQALKARRHRARSGGRALVSIDDEADDLTREARDLSSTGSCVNAQHVEMLANQTLVTVQASGTTSLDRADAAFRCASSAVVAGSLVKSFVLSPPKSGRYKISTCSGSWDSVMQVRVGHCEGVILGCNDDTVANTKFCSTMEVVADRDEPLFIQVASYNNKFPATISLTISKSMDVVGGVFRLALVTNREYSRAVGNTKSSVANAVAAVMSRVNGIYLRELGIFFQLIADNDKLFCSADNLALGGCDTLPNDGNILSRNQNFIESARKIPSASYDLGHSFTTGSGGVAGLGVLCTAFKAQGTTGSTDPRGDPFSVDYVAHEIGHQLNGDHTFRDCPGQPGQGVEEAAVEPGSGSTIMAYAGICGSAFNLQVNSDPYFHGISLQAIRGFAHGQLLSSPNCGSGLTYSRTPDAEDSRLALDRARLAQTCTVPVGNFVRLRGVILQNAWASSATTRFQWDQMDPGRQSFATTSVPRFRSWKPTSSRDRFLPNLYYLTHGLHQQSPHRSNEILPNSTRSMTFRFVARTLYDSDAASSTFDQTLFGDFAFRDISVGFSSQVPPLLFDAATRANLSQKTSQGPAPLTFRWTAGGGASAEVSVYVAMNSMASAPIATKFDYERDVKDLDWVLLGTAANSAGSATFDIPRLGGPDDLTVNVSFLLAPAGLMETDATCVPFDLIARHTRVQFTSSPTTGRPSASPTTLAPSKSPSASPTQSPTPPTFQPTASPSASPTVRPSMSPTVPTSNPTASPVTRRSLHPRCMPRVGRTLKNCRTSFAYCRKVGHPIKWGYGCVVNKRRLGDGGCVCKGYCGYLCASACRRDSECAWDGAKCVSKQGRIPGGKCVP